ncbi:hypothetical protein [Aliikangiella sp. IMCC44359]|uniref:hypothetical protein n=1 Tax=Aliikangiella sp. IMCC44359 TaxID=3459125 RepID=UPI00403AA08D
MPVSILQRTLALFIFCFAITGNSQTMKPFYNQETLNRFKSKIDYAVLTQSLKTQSPIFANWQNNINTLSVNNEVWRRIAKNPPSIFKEHHAGIEVVFEKGEHQITVMMHILTQQSIQTIFDFMLEMMASTSMLDIPYQYAPDGPGDYYFGHGIHSSTGEQSAYSLYSNIIIVANSIHEIDVRPVVSEMIKIIKNESIRSHGYKPVALTCSLSSQKISVGNTFKIYLSQNQMDTDIDIENIKNLFELIEYKQQEIELKALTPGKHVIPVRFMDTNTLYSNVLNVEVTVKP